MQLYVSSQSSCRGSLLGPAGRTWWQLGTTQLAGRASAEAHGGVIVFSTFCLFAV